jgi:hypothetical protein
MLFGATLTPIFTVLLGTDFDLLAAGLVGGSAGYAVDKVRRGRT